MKLLYSEGYPEQARRKFGKKIWTVIGSATEGSLRSPILKDRYDQKIANFIFRWFGWLGGRLVWPVNMLKCT